MKNIQFAWHIHHDKLVEVLTEPFQNRVDYILSSKPKDEHKLRLRLFELVKGELPALNKAREAARAVREAWEAREAWETEREAREAREAWETAREAWEAWENANEAELNALHEAECPDCPWDGKTIFSGARK